MKKLLTTTCAALFLFTLVGCSDATTNVSDNSKALITVGDNEIQKGDLYNGLQSQGNITPVTDALNEAIAAKAVKTTKAIKEEANASLKTLKETNTDWDAYLKSNGYKNEKALLTSLVNKVKENQLTSQYIKDEYANLSTYFEIRELQIIAVTDTAKVKDAQNAAKKGEDMTALATTYGDTTTYNGASAIYTNKSGLPTNVWKETLKTKDGKATKAILDTPTNTYYIVKVVSSKADKLKDNAITAISSLSATNDSGLTIADEAFKFYLDKFDYDIHDATVYSALLTQSSKYER